MSDLFPIQFSETHAALAARVQDPDELPGLARDLGLGPPRPVIVLVGGAGGMSEAELDRLRPLFDEALAPVAEALGAAVVDGGTDAGVMRLMGQARAGRSFPLAGVVVEALAALPGGPAGENQASLEPHHSGFLLTPGAVWGEEAVWISRLATALSGPRPSATVLVNGGEIAYQDVGHSVEARRPVLVVEGSGRTADVLGRAARRCVMNRRARRLAASGLLTSVPLADGPAALAAALRDRLHEEEATWPR